MIGRLHAPRPSHPPPIAEIDVTGDLLGSTTALLSRRRFKHRKRVVDVILCTEPVLEFVDQARTRVLGRAYTPIAQSSPWRVSGPTSGTDWRTRVPVEPVPQTGERAAADSGPPSGFRGKSVLLRTAMMHPPL